MSFQVLLHIKDMSRESPLLEVLIPSDAVFNSAQGAAEHNVKVKGYS